MNAINPTKKSVELSNIIKRFGDFTAVNNVNINIAAGEFCSLLGPSGSGKTTLLKIIAGYETPTEGLVKIDGSDVGHVPVAKRNIGMVFQNYALFPHMTVAKNIAFPLEMRKLSKAEISERVQSTLDLVGLSELGERYPRELSGGQQQRVAVARALVFEPDILLMDEPLGALDKNMRQAMQYELKQLHQRIGVTIIYVTHDQEEALYLSDRVVVFNEGSVAQEGAPEMLYNTPRSAFVADFLGECNIIPATKDNKGAKLESGLTLNLPEGSEEIPFIKIGIRPERISIRDAALACENNFVALIEEVHFLGQGYKVIAKAENYRWSIVTQNKLSFPNLKIDDNISIGFNAEDIIQIIE